MKVLTSKLAMVVIKTCARATGTSVGQFVAKPLWQKKTFFELKLNH
jgi:hypothetical protein